MKKIEVHLEEVDGTNGLMQICLIGGSQKQIMKKLNLKMLMAQLSILPGG